jgi:hypothetical protein
MGNGTFGFTGDAGKRQNQAEGRLRAAVGEFERFIEGGPTGVAKPT